MSTRHPRTLAVAAILGLLPALTGCVDEAAELGRPPPVQLTLAGRDIAVALGGDAQLQPGARDDLRQAVSDLGGSLPLAVRARIRAASDGEAEAVRAALLGFGVDPAHIATAQTPAAGRLLPMVRLTRTFATTRSCDAAIPPARFGDMAPSLDSLQRCVEQNSLAAMLVDPADLVDPPALGPAEAARIGLQTAPLPPAPGSAATTDPGEPAGSYGNGATTAGAAPVVVAKPAAPVPP